MATFKIDRVDQQGSVHFKLFGEFNDMSVCTLIEAIRDGCSHTRDVFIHTGELETVAVSGFGREVFGRNLSNLEEKSVQIHFTGTNGNAMVTPDTLV